jgi:hypothetical protein
MYLAAGTASSWPKSSFQTKMQFLIRKKRATQVFLKIGYSQSQMIRETPVFEAGYLTMERFRQYNERKWACREMGCTPFYGTAPGT